MRSPLFRSFVHVVLVAAVTACAAPKPDADSTATLAAPDTVKAAPVSNIAADSVRRADSVAAAAAAASATKTKSASTKTGVPTKSTTTKTTASDTTKGNPNIGRDSVIRRPPRRLPADTL